METESILLSDVRRYFKENKMTVLELCMKTAFILFPSLNTISQKNPKKTVVQTPLSYKIKILYLIRLTECFLAGVIHKSSAVL